MTDFTAIRPEDLFPGFDPKRQPALDDHWIPGTSMFSPEAEAAKETWHAAEDQWAVANALYQAHRRESVPRRYRDAYEMPGEVEHWVQAMVDGEDPNVLVLYGGVGTGKTHSSIAAACLIHARTLTSPVLYTHGPALHFYLAATLLRELKNFSDQEAREETIWTTRYAKTLILDDLTRPSVSEFDHEAITEILDYRLGRFPTIITSNVEDSDELDEAFGQHLASRLLGGATLVPIVGPDRRRQ